MLDSKELFIFLPKISQKLNEEGISIDFPIQYALKIVGENPEFMGINKAHK